MTVRKTFRASALRRLGQCFATFVVLLTISEAAPPHVFAQTPHMEARTVSGSQTATLKTVQSLLAAAPAIKTLPTNLQPSLRDLENDNGQYWASTQGCYPVTPDKYATITSACTFGDKASRDVIVLNGDSHAAMWINAIDRIGKQTHKKVILFWLGNCGVASQSVVQYWSFSTRTVNQACAPWQDFVLARVKALRPEALILSSSISSNVKGPGTTLNPGQWTRGMSVALTSFKQAAPRASIVVLGSTPDFGLSVPQCLAFHQTDVQTCSAPRKDAFLVALNDANFSATKQTGASYIDVMPWFCSTVCTDVVGNMAVYSGGGHISATYATFLSGVLGSALARSTK